MMQLTRPGLNTTSAALIKIDGLNMLLPQGEIRTLESIAELDTAAPALHSAGWVVYAQKRWPVYCLSEELSLMSLVPAERRACAIMAMGAGYIGILCDDMTILNDFIAQRHEVPVAMRLADTPILHLVAYAQGIACVSNANKLTTYINQLVLESSIPGKAPDVRQ